MSGERMVVFLAGLDRMVNEDRIDDPREVRAALDEAQATIRGLLDELAESRRVSLLLRVAGDRLADVVSCRVDGALDLWTEEARDEWWRMRGSLMSWATPRNVP